MMPIQCEASGLCGGQRIKLPSEVRRTTSLILMELILTYVVAAYKAVYVVISRLSRSFETPNFVFGKHWVKMYFIATTLAPNMEYACLSFG